MASCMQYDMFKPVLRETQFKYYVIFPSVLFRHFCFQLSQQISVNSLKIHCLSYWPLKECLEVKTLMIYICTQIRLNLLQLCSKTTSSSHLRTLIFAVFYILIATAFSKETTCKTQKCGDTSEFTSHHSQPLVDFFPLTPMNQEFQKVTRIKVSVLGQESMYERRKPNTSQTRFFDYI